MAAPSYGLSLATANSSDPAGDILTLVETRLTAAGWVFVEQTAFTQAATARVMRVWKNPAALNVAAVDFYIGLIKNAVAGIYFAARAFEGYNVSTHTMQKPCISGAATHYPVGGYTWIARTMPASGYSALAYGNGVFVALKSAISTAAAVSQDGITWTATTLPASQAWKAVTFGNGVFVAVNVDVGNTISATSPDGITWTQRVITAVPYNAVSYGNGTFVAIGGSGSTVASTSPDGITWTSRTVPAGTYTSIAYGAGLFVAVRSGSTAAISSPDGITWTVVSMPVSTGWASVAYGGSMFVAVSSTNGTIAASSPDGITWTARTLPSTNNWASVAYGNGLFFTLGGAASGAASSVDGQTWTARTVIGTPTSVCGNSSGQFVAVTSTNTAVLAWDYDPSPNWSAGNKDWLADGSTQPAIAEAQPTAVLAVSTSYDVAVLASKSYLVLGVYAAGSGTMKVGWLLGLVNPVYPDSPATFPPLAVITANGGYNTATGGMSRSLRYVSGSAPFGVTVGPESLLLGVAFAPLTKESASNLLRTARVSVGGVQTAAFTGAGYRGWAYDGVAVGITGPTVSRPSDTVTIGATTYVVMINSLATANFLAVGSCAYCFDTSAGS